eukprot:CAMPEP_0174733028 /NCGR_PEP_ID=MMETSP1094-20130205/60522_1 /TAXON_ID=156173 /ORGANISM="Chrysochromulina brevifilum, Strain UTEX LB 985" /LENGTH=37 /DNA_ID= /DNA_START= /DNA_END= /DNA_ORIENTATION=
MSPLKILAALWHQAKWHRAAAAAAPPPPLDTNAQVSP